MYDLTLLVLEMDTPSKLPRPVPLRKRFLRTGTVFFPLALVAGTLLHLLNPASVAWIPQPLPESIARRSIEFQQQACTLRLFKAKIAPYCARFGISEGTLTPQFVTSPLNVFEVYTPVRVGGGFLADHAKRDRREAGSERDVEDAEDVADGVERRLENRQEGTECTQVLMEHTFGFSFGIPFVANYTPPDCQWTNVLINMTMTINGTQFDRLAMMYMGDVEVFRTSTAEPTRAGIIFNYVKDMTRYASLFRTPQILIFDLQNLINDQFTGFYAATLTATYYSPPQLLAPKPADSIFPISSHMSTQGQRSVFSLPSDRAVSAITFPLNTTRAVVGITSSGDSNEEFWYTNVPSAYTQTWPGVTQLLGFGPFREVQILIDGTVAGVAWPFETVFTGGIVPTLWQPIVSITAYDLPEYEIDITPFLPLLLDGTAHEFEIRVLSFDDSSGTLSTQIGSDWLTAGRVFVWSDPVEDWRTTGTVETRSLPDPSFTSNINLERAGNGSNVSLAFDITATRSILYTASLNTSSGTQSVSWAQDLNYTYSGFLDNLGNNQVVTAMTAGSDAAGDFGSREYSFPFNVTFAFIAINANEFNLTADLHEGLEVTGMEFYSEGIAVGGDRLSTTRHSTSPWNSRVGGSGNSSQEWTFEGPLRNAEGVESYERSVASAGMDVVLNVQTVNGVLAPEECVNIDEC